MRNTFSLALGLGLLAATPALADGGASAGASPWTILVLYTAGMLFLLFEAFLVPGFGLPGLLGCGLIATNLFLVFSSHGSAVAWMVLAGQIVVGFGLTFVAMKVLPHTALGKAMTHEVTLETKAAPNLDPDLWVGRAGESVDALSPQGTVRIDDEDLPAKARSGLIKEGTPIEVVAVDGRTLVVSAKE